jgi:hypothetical protein
MFQLPELSPYHGVEKFDSPALSVQRITGDTFYHYEVRIHDHSNPIPALPNGVSSVSTGNGEREAERKKRPASSPLLPVMLLIVGVGLLGGAGLYLILARGPSRDRSARTLRF